MNELYLREKHGKRVKRLFLLNPEQLLSPNVIESGPELEMYFANDFHGDHETLWVVLFENGKEISRFNIRAVAFIVWEEE